MFGSKTTTAYWDQQTHLFRAEVQKESSSSKSTESQKKTYYVEITGNVNLREKIGTDTKVLLVIPKSTKLTCVEKETTPGGYVWYKTTYKNQTGWFYGRYAKEISS